MRDRFHEDAEFLLEEALRKHLSISTSHNPTERQAADAGALMAVGPASLLRGRQLNELAVEPPDILPGHAGAGALVIVHPLGLTYIVLPLAKQTQWFTVRRLRIDRLF